MNKRLFLSLILSAVSTSIMAGDCCPSFCEGGSAPLICGQWSIVPKIGVAPTKRTQQGCVWLTNPCFPTGGPICDFCNTDTTMPEVPSTPNSPVFSVSKTAKFSSQFKTPLAAGVELQYALNEYHMVYLEYAYRHANSKAFAFTAGAFEVCETTNDFKSNAIYLGARNYFNRVWCDKVSFFVGLKVGLLHRNQICYDLNLAIPSFNIPQTAIATNVYFFSDNVISGGLNLGFDYQFNCNWSFQFNAEVVASAGHRTNENVVFGRSAGLTDPADRAKLAALAGLTNVNIGPVGTEVQFPITFGIRYNY